MLVAFMQRRDTGTCSLSTWNLSRGVFRLDPIIIRCELYRMQLLNILSPIEQIALPHFTTAIEMLESVVTLLYWS